ncbi:MAG: hypothetical protein WBX22_01595 [Silvibacterium sp.]
MSARGTAVLRISKAPKPVMPFEVGALVMLRCCPSEIPGRVVGGRGKLILVAWSDLDYVGKHKADSLMLAEDTEAK